MLTDGLDSATLTGATVSICRNGMCATGAVPASGVDGDFQFQVSGAFFADVNLLGYLNGIELDWDLQTIDDGRSGDRFDVTLTASDGTVVAHKAWTATSYSHTYPNGHDCDDGCNQASLDEQT